MSDVETIEVEPLANMHSHLRESSMSIQFLEYVLKGGSRVVLPMPNTDAGLKTAKEVREYASPLESFAQKNDAAIVPIAMITEDTTVEMIMECVQAGIWDFKVYPRDRTTKSHNGVVRYWHVLKVIKEASLRCWVEHGRQMRVHFHPEHPNMLYLNRDAEFAFTAIARQAVEETSAIVVWEHGTDARCIPHWEDLAKSVRFWVTLTAHHLLEDEDGAYGDVRSVCKPPPKTYHDRMQLVELVEKDYGWVMAGADDAPHPVEKKHVHEGRCACGAYTAPFLIPLYAHALGHLLKTARGVRTFVNFTNRNARNNFRIVKSSMSRIRLVRSPFKIPSVYEIGGWKIEPFWASRTLDWSIICD